MKLLCPCHSNKLYKDCCKPYHDGQKPENALVLMRSRYSAYSLVKIDYIVATTHPSHPDRAQPIEDHKKSIHDFCRNTVFKGLKILSFEDGEATSYVTFEAILIQNGRNASYIEKSRFETINGQWLYHSGQII